MTEAQWLAAQWGSQAMVWALLQSGKVQRTKVGRRKLRLYGCGCCRLIWPLLGDPRLREAVEVAEELAEGQTTKEMLQSVREKNIELTYGTCEITDPRAKNLIAADMALATTSERPSDAAFEMTACALPLAGYFGGEREGEAVLCHLLRCVFGNPFRPVKSQKAWRNATATILAQTIYEDRVFDRLPILADALEEAGCTNADILAHCRQPGEHVRGCWVVDLLLGKA